MCGKILKEHGKGGGKEESKVTHHEKQGEIENESKAYKKCKVLRKHCNRGRKEEPRMKVKEKYRMQRTKTRQQVMKKTLTN